MTSNSDIDIDRDADATASNLTFSDMNKSQGFFDPPIENYRFIEFGNSDTGFCIERSTRRNDFTSQSQNQLPSSKDDKERHLLEHAANIDDASAQDDSYSCLDSHTGEGNGKMDGASKYRDEAGINHR